MREVVPYFWLRECYNPGAEDNQKKAKLEIKFNALAMINTEANQSISTPLVRSAFKSIVTTVYQGEFQMAVPPRSPLERNVQIQLDRTQKNKGASSKHS